MVHKACYTQLLLPCTKLLVVNDAPCTEPLPNIDLYRSYLAYGAIYSFMLQYNQCMHIYSMYAQLTAVCPVNRCMPS